VDRLPAVAGKNMSLDDRRAHFTDRCHNGCSPAIQGIYMLHRRAWQRVANSGGDGLIFEDDAILAPKCAPELERAWAEVPDDWDVLYLGCFGACFPDPKHYDFMQRAMSAWGKNVRPPVQISERVFVLEYPLGFHAYAVSNKGAKKLLAVMTEIDTHVDVTLAERMHPAGFRVYAVSPNLAHQDLSTSSSNLVRTSVLLNLLADRVYVSRNNRYTLGRFLSECIVDTGKNDYLRFRFAVWDVLFVVLVAAATIFRVPEILLACVIAKAVDLGAALTYQADDASSQFLQLIGSSLALLCIYSSSDAFEITLWPK
jgi:GR25 family glycosyltransferase involved in LPS biosynthesis